MNNINKEYYKIANTKGILAVPEPYRTIIAVETVQGLIDNGGLGYLYENSFAGGFDIEIFIQSYNNIKCSKMADILANSFAKKEDKKLLQKYDNEIFKLSNKVWANLDKFIKEANYDI